MSGIILADRFELRDVIGEGSFGKIQSALDTKTDSVVAVKLESIKLSKPQLENESKVYKLLQGKPGISRVHYFGQENEQTIMAIDLLGPSVFHLWRACGRLFSLKTTLMLADQILTRTEALHSVGIVHRDQKPENYCVGREVNKQTIYMIDFGIAVRFTNGGQHAPFKEKCVFAGTAKYCSINVHLGYRQSRRDDIEALGYIFVFFVKGSLPWQALQRVDKSPYASQILEKKQATPLDQLCRGIAPELASFLSYARSLRYEDTPDYGYLRTLIRDLAAVRGITFDNKFDWMERGIDSDNFKYEKGLKDDDQAGEVFQDEEMYVESPMVQKVGNVVQEEQEDDVARMKKLSAKFKHKKPDFRYCQFHLLVIIIFQITYIFITMFQISQMLMYPKWNEVTVYDMNQENSSIRSSFLLNWTVKSNTIGIFRLKQFDKFGQNATGRMIHNFYDYGDVSNENLSARSIGLNMYLQDGSAQQSDADTFSGYGYYYPDYKRGVIAANIPRYRKTFQNISIDEYYQQISSDEYYPNENLTIISKEQEQQAPNIDPYTCTMRLYFTISEIPRLIKPNQYPPDYEAMYNESRPLNKTHEMVDAIDSHFVSQNCAFYFHQDGPIYNPSKMWYEQQYFSVIFMFCMSWGIISGIKFMLMINSEARVARISLTSLVCQLIFDFAFSLILMSCAIGGQIVLLLCCALLFIYAMYVDVTLMFTGYMNYLRQNGAQNNRWGFVKIMAIFYIVMFLWIFIEPFLPAWTTFILVMVLSSHWFIQSIHCYRKDIKGRPYPLDYIILQSIIKYGPCIYCYGIKNNFSGFEVLDWYIYVMGIWFSFQFALIITQYILGSRFGLKKKEESKQQFDYAKQRLHPFILGELDTLIDASQLYKDGSNYKFIDFLINSERTYLLPLASNEELEYSKNILSFHPKPAQNDEHQHLLDNENINHSELQNDNLIVKFCMNPLHTHSCFYDDKFKVEGDDIASLRQIKYVQASAHCFYCLKQSEIQELIQCTICMEDIDFSNAKNQIVMAISNEPEEIQMLQSKQCDRKQLQEIWITPCGHCFHQNCLGRWGAENLTCPSDRQPIPPMENEVWYE